MIQPVTPQTAKRVSLTEFSGSACPGLCASGTHDPEPFSPRSAQAFLSSILAATAASTGVPCCQTMAGEDLSKGATCCSFCRLVQRIPEVHRLCRETRAALERRAAITLSPQVGTCFAGLAEVAVPVVENGRHAATLWCGPVLIKAPTHESVRAAMSRQEFNCDDSRREVLMEAYFAVPVVPLERLRAVRDLLNAVRQHMIDVRPCSRTNTHPRLAGASPITKATHFIDLHFAERLTLGAVARHVNLSKHHFCRAFSKEVGFSFTQYVTRVRLQRALHLLQGTEFRVTEIGSACGFGSLPRFYAAFKQQEGMSPTEYRRTH